MDVIEEGALKSRIQASVVAEAVRASEDPLQRVEDILRNIGRIEEFTADMNAPVFAGDADLEALRQRAA